MQKDKPLQNRTGDIHSLNSKTNINLLTAILESSPNIIVFALDTEYKYLAFNHEHTKVMQTLWGKEIELGSSMLEIIAREDDCQKAKNLFDRALSGESFVDESEYGDEAFSRKFWNTYYSPIYDDTHEKVIGLTCYNLDISQRKNTEITLTKTASELTTLLNSLPGIVWMKDINGTYIAANPALELFFGVVNGGIIGKTDYNLMDKNSADLCKQTDLEAMKSGKLFIGEEVVTDHNGKQTIFEIRKVSVYDEDQVLHGVIGIGTDITERKQIESQLQLADLALNIITDGLYLIDENREIIYVNKAACDSLGYTKEELIGKTPLDIDPMVTPEIMKKIRETVEIDYPMHFETKHKRKDGSIFDVEITTYPYMGGKIGLSIVKDITDRKKTEEKLKLLASVFTSAKEGIVITDTRGIIVDANEAYSFITGYSKDEVIGQNAGFLKSDKHEKEFYKRMWSELIQNKYWIGEIWNRRRDGEIFVERLTISAISDSEGKTSSYVGLLTDITTGKDYESTLERMAFYDSLTGLPNRMLLSERINQAMTFTKRLKSMMAVCYLDLDGFKPVNDSFGHSVGDKLLIEVANRMQECIRESDTVARIGGDEFAILLLNVTNNEECEITVSKILESINEPYIINNIMSIKVTASIGITLFPQDGSSSDLLLRHADQAMYLAKESGKNKYIFHS